MFNRDQNFKGNSFTRNYQILNSTVVNNFQDSKVSTSILWRHNHRKFSDGSRNYYMQCRWLQGPSKLSTPRYSQLILRIYAAMNGLVGGSKTEFTPGRGKPQVRHWMKVRSLVVYSANRLHQGSPTFLKLRATSWHRFVWRVTSLIHTLLK